MSNLEFARALSRLCIRSTYAYGEDDWRFDIHSSPSLLVLRDSKRHIIASVRVEEVESILNEVERARDASKG